MICSECGKDAKTVRGSMKHPYCQVCFYDIWHDDYKLYGEYLNNYHPMSVKKFFKIKAKNDKRKDI